MSTVLNVVNKNFQPTENQETVLEVFKQGRDSDGPWGYANPMRIRLETGLRKQRINDALGSLEDAGWVEQVRVDGGNVRGLYRFVEDPRGNGDGD